MKSWERELIQMMIAFEDEFDRRPTAILAWNDAYRRIKADWQNVVLRKGSPKIIWKGLEVLRVDAPGDRIVLDGGKLDLDWED